MSDRHSGQKLDSEKKRTVLKALAGTGASALVLPGLVSADDDSTTKSSEGEFEKLKELDHEERDRVLEDKFGDDVSKEELKEEFGDALEFEDDNITILSKEVTKTVSVPGVDDVYVTVTLGDWEVDFEVKVQGAVFVSTTIDDACEDTGKVCGDILFADGCSEYTYSREDEYLEYDIDGQIWAGTWHEISASDKIDLSDEFDQADEDWSDKCS